jgi:nucleotide-binding universal stress UspA family protein
MSADEPTGPALLCWDGSDSALGAIRHAARILGPGHAAVVFFAHVPTEAARGLLGGLSGPDAPIMGVGDAEALIERGVGLAREAGLEAAGLRVEAERKTSEIIVATAEDQDATLIAMGQRQRSALGTLLLGSVARDVLDSFHRPVLLVGPAGAAPYPRG